MHTRKHVGGEWGVQLNYFITSTVDGGGQIHALATVPPDREAPYPSNRRLGGPQTVLNGVD